MPFPFSSRISLLKPDESPGEVQEGKQSVEKAYAYHESFVAMPVLWDKRADKEKRRGSNGNQYQSKLRPEWTESR